jgi:O-succinylbenzoate synthase
MRIAADESVRKAEDPLAVARAGAADLIVVKAQPLGGIAPALAIIEEAQLPIIVSSALDTSVGISMGLHLASALPDGALAGACGLGTVALLDGDVVADRLLPEGGALRVRRPALDAGALERYRATPDRERWWQERVSRCHAALTEPG